MTDQTTAPSVPFWESKVFLAGLAAFGAQAFDLLLNAPVDVLMAAATGDGTAIRKIAAIVFTGLVLWLRGRSKMQPLTLGMSDPAAAPKLCLVALAIGMVGLGGCQTVKENPASAQLVTQYAVAKYLEGKKTDQSRYESAVRIVKIASDLKSVTSGSEVRLDSLRVYVTGALAAQPLSPADRVLASGLSELLLSELESRFKSGGGILKPEQVVLVNDVLNWVISVAMTIPSPLAERPQ